MTTTNRSSNTNCNDLVAACASLLADRSPKRAARGRTARERTSNHAKR